MKHIKTFESFVNEEFAQEQINEAARMGSKLAAIWKGLESEAQKVDGLRITDGKQLERELIKEAKKMGKTFGVDKFVEWVEAKNALGVDWSKIIGFYDTYRRGDLTQRLADECKKAGLKCQEFDAPLGGVGVLVVNE